MSASSAKVSRKENSNHDGADESSGKVEQWRRSERHFQPFSAVCFALSFLRVLFGNKCMRNVVWPYKSPASNVKRLKVRTGSKSDPAVILR